MTPASASSTMKQVSSPATGAGGLRQLLRSAAQPALASALDDFPGFGTLVDVQGEALEALQAALGLEPARTKHTDANGLLKLQSLQPGTAANLFRSYRNHRPASAIPSPPPPPLRTMTQIFGRYQTPDGTVRVYTKTSASPPDDWPTPQLDVEIGGSEKSLVFYVGLGPKANLATDIGYLERYYLQPPPPPPPELLSLPAHIGSAAAAGASSGGGNGATCGSGDGAVELPAFRDLEAEARRQPGFAPFVSPSLWVRAAAVGALCFSVEWDGGRDPRVVGLIRRYVSAVTHIWLAQLLADRDAAKEADPWVVDQWRKSGVVLRNYVRHDPLTPLLYPVFGEEQVNAWIETVSGEELDP